MLKCIFAVTTLLIMASPESAQATNLKFRYAGQTIEVPAPAGYCFLGNSPNEQLIFDWQANSSQYREQSICRSY